METMRRLPSSQGETKFIFIPTWRCNLKCGYCDYETSTDLDWGDGYMLTAFGKKIEVGAEIGWPVWLYMLERFRPYHLELTGGEPMCYPDLAQFMAHLPVDSTWSITSNSLGRLDRYDAMNCTAWTASYHYHSDNKFMRNLKILDEEGFGPRVTLVLTPENHERVKRAIDKIVGGMDIGVNIHPVLKEGFDWKDHKDLWDEFEAMGDGLLVGFIRDIPKKFEKGNWLREMNCQAGMDYFLLFPDGMVYRCYTHILRGEPIGHIKDVVPFKKPEPCGFRCHFPCDIQVEKS